MKRQLVPERYKRKKERSVPLRATLSKATNNPHCEDAKGIEGPKPAPESDAVGTSPAMGRGSTGRSQMTTAIWTLQKRTFSALANGAVQ